jgi:hypothetical protein
VSLDVIRLARKVGVPDAQAPIPPAGGEPAIRGEPQAEHTPGAPAEPGLMSDRSEVPHQNLAHIPARE